MQSGKRCIEMKIIKLYVVSLIYLAFCYSQKLDFFQNDYDVLVDRVEIVWYNKSIVRNLQAAFVFYNRTQKVLNASFELVRDAGAKSMVDVQAFKFVSNEYRFFPITVSINVCKEYERDTFNTKSTLGKTWNIDPCKFHKGYYWIRNAFLDDSKFPPHLPTGLYKVRLICRLDLVQTGEYNLFAAIKEKPLDWKNIPKM